MDRTKKAVRIILAVGLLVAVGLLMFDRVRPPRTNAASGTEAVTRIENWAAIRDSVAVSIDPPAKLQMMDAAYGERNGQRFSLKPYVIDITTFTDFECPFCLVADSVTKTLAGPLVTRHVVHLPVRGHQQAISAARALECADLEGQAHVMHETLFKRQSELGREPWENFAIYGELEDSTGAALVACMASKPDARIEAGEALAKRLNVKATPAVVINGWLLHPSTPEQIRALFEDILYRRTPR